jgi:hypothetical protein
VRLDQDVRRVDAADARPRRELVRPDRAQLGHLGGQALA